jgi:hypothetical protein
LKLLLEEFRKGCGRRQRPNGLEGGVTVTRRFNIVNEARLRLIDKGVLPSAERLKWLTDKVRKYLAPSQERRQEVERMERLVYGEKNNETPGET